MKQFYTVKDVMRILQVKEAKYNGSVVKTKI